MEKPIVTEELLSWRIKQLDFCEDTKVEDFHYWMGYVTGISAANVITETSYLKLKHEIENKFRLKQTWND